MISLHSILLSVAIAHWLMAAVMAVFARHRVQYLSIAWIVGIFGAAVTCVIPFAGLIEAARPAMLHPGPLFAMMFFVFLQSIYPLSITMPGYLQWERMWRYALPVIVLGVIYGVLTFLGMTSPNYYTWQELGNAFFTLDMFLRLAMLALSAYYIINIFRLPRTMLRYPHVPRYLQVYAFCLGLSSCLYFWTIVRFSVLAFEIWLILFSLANIYMCLRSLETIALSLPQPEIQVVEVEPSIVSDDEEQEDFNEANLRRFERAEFWMQHNRDAWKDNTFGRDQLCEAIGINRHLLLQSVRSQGHNNIHDYINVYRVKELQRMIASGETRTLTACLDAGFGTIKTARSCYEKVTGESLDDRLARYKS